MAGTNTSPVLIDREAPLATLLASLEGADEGIASVRLRSLGQMMLESLAGLAVVAVIIIGSFQVMSGTLKWPGLFAFLLFMANRKAQSQLEGDDIDEMDDLDDETVEDE